MTLIVMVKKKYHLKKLKNYNYKPPFLFKMEMVAQLKFANPTIVSTPMLIAGLKCPLELVPPTWLQQLPMLLHTLSISTKLTLEITPLQPFLLRQEVVRIWLALEDKEVNMYVPLSQM